jgi:hypothetical protein
LPRRSSSLACAHAPSDPPDTGKDSSERRAPIVLERRLILDRSAFTVLVRRRDGRWQLALAHAVPVC